MNRHQDEAITRHCRLSVETMNPRFRRIVGGDLSVIVTVNSGYE